MEIRINRVCRPGRVGTGSFLGGSGGTPPADQVLQVVVISIGVDGVLIQTSAPHGYVAGNHVLVSGNSVGGYNTTHTVSATPGTATTFNTTVTYTVNGTGGTCKKVP